MQPEELQATPQRHVKILRIKKNVAHSTIVSRAAPIHIPASSSSESNSKTSSTTTIVYIIMIRSTTNINGVATPVEYTSTCVFDI